MKFTQTQRCPTSDLTPPQQKHKQSWTFAYIFPLSPFHLFQFQRWIHMGVSKYRGGPPKSSILIGFSIINHPFWGVSPLFLETPIYFVNISGSFWGCEYMWSLSGFTPGVWTLGHPDLSVRGLKPKPVPFKKGKSSTNHPCLGRFHVTFSESVLGCGPLPVTVTTRTITFLIGNPYKP